MSAIASLVLGHVESFVGTADHGRHGLSRQQLGQPTADRDVESQTLEVIGSLADRATRMLGDALHLFQGRVRKHDRELLAAVTRHEVPVWRPLPQDAGDASQDRVTRLMAIVVVEVLEVIDVEHHDRGRSTALGHRLVGFAHGLVERAAIGQHGQGVGAGFRGVTDQLLRLGLQLGFGGMQLLLHPLVGLDELVHRLEHGGRFLILRRVEFVRDATHEGLVLVDVGRDVVGQFAQPFEDLPRSLSIVSCVSGRSANAGQFRVATNRPVAPRTRRCRRPRPRT